MAVLLTLNKPDRRWRELLDAVWNDYNVESHNPEGNAVNDLPYPPTPEGVERAYLSM
jgi:hypothetical protein